MASDPLLTRPVKIIGIGVVLPIYLVLQFGLGGAIDMAVMVALVVTGVIAHDKWMKWRRRE